MHSFHHSNTTVFPSPGFETPGTTLHHSNTLLEHLPLPIFTTTLLVPVALIGELVIGNEKWEAPESHIAN
eukprot:10649646-Prorocentrum_lima.AAC.1